MRSHPSLNTLVSLGGGISALILLIGCGGGGGGPTGGGTPPTSLTKLTIIDSITFNDNKVPVGFGPDGKFAFGIQGAVGDTSVVAAGKTYAVPEQSTIDGLGGTVVRADEADGSTWFGHLDSSTLTVVIDKRWSGTACDFVTPDGWSLNENVATEAFALISPTGTATALTVPSGFSPVQMSSKFVLITNATGSALKHRGTGAAFFAGRLRASKAAVNRAPSEYRVISPTTSLTLKSPAGATGFQGLSVSEEGTTAGQAFLTDGNLAGAVWDAQGNVTVLPSLAATDMVQASAINKDGIVVGTEQDQSGSQSTGVIWQKGVVKPQSAFITSSSIDAFDAIDDAWHVVAESADGTFYLLQGS